MVLSRCMHPGHVLLRATPAHAAAATIAFRSIGSAVSTKAGAALLGAHGVVLFAAVLTEGQAAVVGSCAGVLYAAIPANQSVVAVVAAIGLIVWIGAGNVVMKPSIGAVVAI